MDGPLVALSAKPAKILLLQGYYTMGHSLLKLTLLLTLPYRIYYGSDVITQGDLVEKST
jgi:hypothetical protein